MTVIVFDGTFFVADRKATSFGGIAYAKNKTVVVPGGIIGCAGDGQACNDLVDWFKSGRIPQDYPIQKSDKVGHQATGLFVDNDGKIWRYSANASPTEIQQSYMAIGSGATCAITAMWLKNNAIVAVKAAIANDSACGHGFTVHQFDKQATGESKFVEVTTEYPEAVYTEYYSA